MSRTTPTTSNSPAFSNDSPMRRPRTSPSGNSLRAAASLRIATLGPVGPSRSVKLRPRRTGTPIVAKNAGETSILYMVSTAGACDACPCFHVGSMNVVAESSGARVNAADLTPGIVPIRSSTWPKSREARSRS